MQVAKTVPASYTLSLQSVPGPSPITFCRTDLKQTLDSIRWPKGSFQVDHQEWATFHREDFLKFCELVWYHYILLFGLLQTKLDKILAGDIKSSCFFFLDRCQHLVFVLLYSNWNFADKYGNCSKDQFRSLIEFPNLFTPLLFYIE